MGPRAIQQRDLERDAASRQICAHKMRDFARAGGDFQQRKMPQPGHLGNLLNQLLRGGYSAKPPVDEGDILQRGLNIPRRARARVETFADVHDTDRRMEMAKARDWSIVAT